MSGNPYYEESLKSWEKFAGEKSDLKFYLVLKDFYKISFELDWEEASYIFWHLNGFDTENGIELEDCIKVKGNLIRRYFIRGLLNEKTFHSLRVKNRIVK